MTLKRTGIKTEEDFPLTTDKTDRMMLRLPMFFRERFLSVETKDMGCKVQPRGTYLQIQIPSERFVALVMFEYPIDYQWLEGKPEERAVTDPWKIDVTQWKDLLQTKEDEKGGLFVHGQAEMFEEEEEI